MRILVGFGHESNMFTPFLMLIGFQAVYGADIDPALRRAYGGIVATLERQPDIELVLTITAHAMPAASERETSSL